MSIAKNIENIILKQKKGRIFFVSDFDDFENYDAVRKALQRLVDKGMLVRLGTGIYYYPKKDKMMGTLFPSIDKIAKAIAKRDKARIIPAGDYALYLLGLSEQIPMNVVFLTDGAPREVVIGNRKIIFKKTSPKNLAIKNKLANYIIQSLKSIGREHVNEQHLYIIKQHLDKSKELHTIKKEMNHAPVWIRKTINPLIKKKQNELA